SNEFPHACGPRLSRLMRAPYDPGPLRGPVLFSNKSQIRADYEFIDANCDLCPLTLPLETGRDRDGPDRPTRIRRTLTRCPSARSMHYRATDCRHAANRGTRESRMTEPAPTTSSYDRAAVSVHPDAVSAGA